MTGATREVKAQQECGVCARSSLYVTLLGRYDGPADYAFSVVLACTP